MKLYCYHISPIDLWHGAMTREVLLKTLIEDEYQDWGDLESVCRHLYDLQLKAEAVFKKLEWDGDTAAGPYYFVLPDEVQTAFGFMLKQSNNGSTFIASPYELPHLDTLAMVPNLVVD